MEKSYSAAVSNLKSNFGTVLPLIFLLFLNVPAKAGSYLFFREVQIVGGYFSPADKIELFSMTHHDAMQKPGIGFDYIQRISGKQRDWGLLALQTRIVYAPESAPDFQVQVYNAYIQYKLQLTNFWLGHNRPASGLSANLDNHALLLPSPAMLGFGFDRDWGLGATLDYSSGDMAFSVTSGSGMPLLFKKNYLTSFRISHGILEEQNYSYGFSLGYGQTLNTMGYELVDSRLHSLRAIGFDLTYLYTRFENRWDLILGQYSAHTAALIFWRSGINLLPENKLKFEIQPVYTLKNGTSNFSFASGLSYQLTSFTTARAMYQFDHDSGAQSVVFQVYYYK